MCYLYNEYESQWRGGERGCGDEDRVKHWMVDSAIVNKSPKIWAITEFT